MTSTRAWVLQGIDHPAVPLLRRYKELYRVWTAHGWAWRADVGARRAVPPGVRAGRRRLRPLGHPRRRRAADPQGGPGRGPSRSGWRLVVADAGQLEPRILAAVSGDARHDAAAGAGDMYAALAEAAFDGDRAKAKVALLGAMYGQTGGQAAPALAALRPVVSASAGVRGGCRPDRRGRWTGAVVARPDLPRRRRAAPVGGRGRAA